MAYSETLAQRIREIVYEKKDVSERKMFGGICFMVGGNMICGVDGDQLMARVNPENHKALLAKPHVLPMEFTGRSMKGYLFIQPEGIKTKKQLAYWVDQGMVVAQSLPPKGSKGKTKGKIVSKPIGKAALKAKSAVTAKAKPKAARRPAR